MPGIAVDLVYSETPGKGDKGYLGVETIRGGGWGSLSQVKKEKEKPI